MADFSHIDQVIQANLQEFNKPGAMTVRPGYKITGGWITQQNAIVVTVDKKMPNVDPKNAVPAVVGGYPTDVREATQMQRLRHVDAVQQATVSALARLEYEEPEFPLELDIRTGQRLEKAPLPDAVAAHLSKPRVPYTPAPGVPLTVVEDTMSITCHASPDAGWLELSAFLKDIQERLTVGMYDFTSEHVLQGVLAGLSGKQNLSLVLDHPAPNPTMDRTDEQTQQALTAALGAREQFAWAAEGNDPMVKSAIFPNAYHIKVAVKDQASFWLSSGNFNNSNQPDINPFAAGANIAQIDQIANRSDRDWHVIVEHKGLAKTFEAYLQHDRTVAAGMQIIPKTKPPAPTPPALIPGKVVPRKYFPAKQITNQKVKVQPLLTPDAGAGNCAQGILTLINSAQTTLDIQTQYIHPPTAGADLVFQALIDAVKRKIDKGVTVRIILSEYEATGSWLGKLQEAGIDASKVVRIQNGVHNKGFVVDSKIVALGSQNWSGDGVLRNRDATLIIWSLDAAQYFEEIFDYDWHTFAKQHLATQVSTKGKPEGMAAD